MKRWRFTDLSEAAQAAVLTAMSVGLPLVGLAVASGALLYSRMTVGAERLLATQLDDVVAQIDGVNEAHLREVRALGAQPRTGEYCAADEAGRAGLQGGARDVLGAFAGAGDAVATVNILSPTGIVWVSTNQAVEGVDASNRAFIVSAMGGDEAVGDIFRSIAAAGGVLMMGFAAPVRDGTGAVRCVVVVSTQAGELTNILGRNAEFAGAGSYTVLLDAHGVRMSHSSRQEFVLHPTGAIPPEEAMTMVRERRFGEETAALLAAPVLDQRLFELARAPELPTDAPAFWGPAPAPVGTSLTIVRRIRTAPWTLVARIPEEEVLGPVWAVLRRQAAFGAVGLVVALAVALAAARERVRRVSAMAAAADEVAAGQLTARIVIQGSDELARVAGRFNLMVASLQVHRNTLEARVAERTAALAAANVELGAQKEELRAQGDELRAQRDELQAQAAELLQRNTAVETANRLKSEFLSNMSHELRTPLNSVIGYADLLTDADGEPLSSRQREFAEAIGKAGRHQLALISDILDLSKIEAGHLRLSPEVLSVVDVLRAARDAVIPQARRKQTTLTMGSVASRGVLADPARLHQILLNLLSNAVKFSPHASNVDITAVDVGEQIVFEVADRGPGLADELWARLFQPFQQGDSPLVKRHEGTGLGLTICRRLVEAHGGSIDARPRPGGGLIVRFTMAAARDAGMASPVATSITTIRRVLVIDDDPAVAALLAGILSDHGFAVESAPTGEAGLKRVATGAPDLCIIDLRLPGANGFDVLTQLRGTPAGASLPVVVFSGADLQDHEIIRLRNHAAVLVRKGDVSALELVSGIQRALRGATVAADARAAGAPRVLVVDDHDMNRALTRAVLEARGFQVLEASDAVTGLQVAGTQLPSIVLMDLAMPGMDGLEAIRRLKADPSTSDLPVVALTALAMRRDEEAAKAAGADAYLTKPIEAELLVRTILRILAGVSR